MKKNFLFVALLVFSHVLFAQDFSYLKDVDITTKEQCRQYDSTALECANYIIATPVDDNTNRLIAMSFMTKWMMATPDFNFSLDANSVKLGGKKDLMLGVYMACMTKYCLEHRDKATDNIEVAVNTYHLVAEYCRNEANNVKKDKDIKKLLEADANGTLKEYLKL